MVLLVAILLGLLLAILAVIGMDFLTCSIHPTIYSRRDAIRAARQQGCMFDQWLIAFFKPHRFR